MFRDSIIDSGPDIFATNITREEMTRRIDAWYLPQQRVMDERLGREEADDSEHYVADLASMPHGATSENPAFVIEDGQKVEGSEGKGHTEHTEYMANQERDGHMGYHDDSEDGEDTEDHKDAQANESLGADEDMDHLEDPDYLDDLEDMDYTDDMEDTEDTEDTEDVENMDDMDYTDDLLHVNYRDYMATMDTLDNMNEMEGVQEGEDGDLVTAQPVHNTCPLCRAELFPQISKSEVESIQQLRVHVRVWDIAYHFAGIERTFMEDLYRRTCLTFIHDWESMRKAMGEPEVVLGLADHWFYLTQAFRAFQMLFTREDDYRPNPWTVKQKGALRRFCRNLKFRLSDIPVWFGTNPYVEVWLGPDRTMEHEMGLLRDWIQVRIKDQSESYVIRSTRRLMFVVRSERLKWGLRLKLTG
ncbi:MAG: hypothetical protein Q9170_002729 [Blastenia crenularia]